MAVLVGLVVTILLVSACGAPSPAIRLDERDSGKTTQLYYGDYFHIVLRENPTSGYMWDLAPGSAEPGVFEVAA